MEALANNIQQKYIDDISAKYPMHRFVCLYIYLFSFFVYSQNDFVRLIVEAQNFKIKFLFDFNDGLLAQVNVLMLFVCVVATFVTVRVNNYIKRKIFSFLFSLHESTLYEYVNRLKDRVRASKTTDRTLTSSFVVDIRSSLELKRAVLKGNQAISETILTLVLCLMAGISSFCLIDWLWLVGGIVIILYAQWDSYKYYISNFLPYYISEQILIGNDVSPTVQNDELH